MALLAPPKLVSPDTTDIPSDLLSQWHEIANLMAELMDVEAGLVMRGNPDSMEVLAASAKATTPYEQGEKAPRDGRLYCETVIATQKPLIVEDAFHDPVWQGNPDTKLGLASYFGLPINWPSGENLGTICVLSVNPRLPSDTDRALIEKLRDLIESHLALLIAKHAAEFAARHDGLTGLLDRHIFIQEAEACLNSWQHDEHAPLMLVWDIAKSRIINMRLGMAVADFVIQEVADRAQVVLSEARHIGRLGGDEFAAIFTNPNLSVIEQLTTDLKAATADIHLNYSDNVSGLTLYTGYAMPDPNDSVGEWLDKADQQKYRAKHEGRSRTSTM